MPRSSSVRKVSRVRKYTVRRQLEASLTLPQIQQHGFTHPQNGFWVMLPREFDVILAFEPRATCQVILEVLRQTVGRPSAGPLERCVWAQLSYGHFACTGHMARSTAQRALEHAVKAGYLLRRRTGPQSWEYAIRWKSAN